MVAAAVAAVGDEADMSEVLEVVIKVLVVEGVKTLDIYSKSKQHQHHSTINKKQQQ